MKQTIRKIGYAPITLDENGEDVYGEVTWLKSTEAGGREYSAEPQGETTPTYADGICVFSAEQSDGYTIKLVILQIIDKIDVDWLGNKKKGNGTAEYADGEERPRFVLLVIDDTTDKTGITTVFYNCQASKRPTVAGKTAEGSKFDAQFAEIEIAARPREKDSLVKFEIPGKTQIAKVPEPEDAIPAAEQEG